MKLILAGLFILAVGTHAQWYHFPREAAQGAGDMWRAHSDMKEANLKDSEDYYQARGNHEAAQRGPGGKWMAEVISDAREKVQEKGDEDAGTMTTRAGASREEIRTQMLTKRPTAGDVTEEIPTSTDPRGCLRNTEDETVYPRRCMFL
ncbi:hypothetical protein NHX12_004637 [Muraenolepis orangiensis]|uniref:Serum amyloid A protein n=1 Tax=Muraenolepis orangiensis TaxID=630683 RepID=A0A9Q0IET0_9TELE|nr:hypothetical protein NHX12_004637 [Muraenolepis orangiensis]